MKPLATLIITAVFVAGCSTSGPTPSDKAELSHTYRVILGGGTEAWHVDCPDGSSDYDLCFDRARGVCPHGFNTLQRLTEDSVGGRTLVRYIIVDCKDEPMQSGGEP